MKKRKSKNDVATEPSEVNLNAENVTEESPVPAPAEEQTAVADGAETLPDVQAEQALAAAGTESTAAVALPRKDKELTKKQQRLRTALRWTLMTVGVIMMSVSIYFFQIPNNFTLGGAAGIAILLSRWIPLSQGVILAILNAFLLILGLIILGKQCTVRTIYCAVLYTFIVWLLEFTDVLGHIDSALVKSGLDGLPRNGEMITLTNQPFLELVYAILLLGVGGAIVFNCGASSGGTDIIALILKKFTKINVGMALLIIDLIVVCVSIFAFDDVTTALFSFMGLFAKSFLLDSVIENIGKTKYITIITAHPEEIGKFILEGINHGYTIYDAEGGYTHEKKKVLVTICKRGEALKLKTKVKELDSEAFVIITDANEILGKGFGGTI